MLPHRVGLRAMTGYNASGAVHAAAVTRPAHVEEKASLRIDERTGSETAGTEITMGVRVIVQLEDYRAPGSLVEWNGRTLTVANAARFEHPYAPSHADLGCV